MFINIIHEYESTKNDDMTEMNRLQKIKNLAKENFLKSLYKSKSSMYNNDRENVLEHIIRSVTINEKKKIVTVVFNHGEVYMSKCSKLDEFDPQIGIAICICSYYAGSKSAFKKFVKRKTSKGDLK